MKIGIFANLSKPRAAATLKELSEAAEDLGVTWVASNREVLRHLPAAVLVPPERLGRSVSVLLSLGGDGTVLQSVRSLRGAKTPILGINLGNLGFLTSVPDSQAVAALHGIVENQYRIASYPLLEARLLHGKSRTPLAKAKALNDIVIGWGTSPRATMIDVHIEQRSVASYLCDGLIVATPIGSTGHALSAGGPILHRDLPAVVVEPICPHTLSNRPLVIPNHLPICLRVGKQGKKLLLSVDGQEVGWMDEQDRLEIRRTAQQAHFIQLPDYSWFRLLTQKLHWRGSSTEPK
ncbi:MAG: NAD(+)/NADH kinase [Verrucomicrobiota bacterium]|nr:NAD(+)/NADH kinase [Verrucomicrobiota bacterium]